MQKLYYVTSNTKKYETVATALQHVLPSVDIEQKDIDIQEIQSLDQRAVALDKAQQAWQLMQAPLLVDDSGIFFEKYYKFPGVYSKFVYQGIGIEGIKKLVNPGDGAAFILNLVYIEGADTYHIFQARSDGSIVHQEHYSSFPHHPYDGLFVPNGTNKTYGQLRAEGIAGPYDYRVQAIKKFAKWYTSR